MLPQTRDHQLQGRNPDILPPPTRKKHGDATQRASAVKARVTIQEVLSAKLSTLYVDNLFNAHVGPSDECLTIQVTPDGDDDDKRLNNSDDDDYDPTPISKLPPKPRPKKVSTKNSDLKLALDCNFMCYLCPDTFNHELFRRGKPDMYCIAEMEQFDTDFRLQLHFNFLATRNTFKKKQSLGMNCASHICDVNLDALPPENSTLVLSSKRKELSRYVLEDILDCPVGCRFIICIAADNTNDDAWGGYYAERASAIATDLKREGLPVESWRMTRKKYVVVQGKID